MKIETLRIENFRSFKDETIHFDNYTCFVGPNGSGKSTVINALNVFFRQVKDTKTDFSRLSIEDFHHKNIAEPIRITVTFTDLSEQAKIDLSDYVRQNKLIVTSVAEYDPESGFSDVKQFGNRLGFEDFRKYFEADKRNVKVDELKSIYANLKKDYKDLPAAATKPAMEKGLREYEAAHPEECTLIPSEDQFYGISKGVNRLAPHIQWVFVSASKDVTEECEESKNSALGLLLARTVRSKINFSEKIDNLKKDLQKQYQSILDAEQGALNNISCALKSRLETWSHPGISAQVLWKNDADRSIKVEEPWAFIKIGERGFEGNLARFGHGLQRSYMLALLQELTMLPDASVPKLVMAIEEPEIYQHPPQARYLAETLYDLSEKNAQIMICSHHPLFIPGDNFEAIRVVREKNNPSTSYISSLKYADLEKTLTAAGQEPLKKEEGMLAKLYPSLNPIINEMFFCSMLILTEGIEDVAYISTYLMLDGKMDDFRKHGCHIVPVGGKSEIIKPLAMAKLLNIPVFVIFDADTDKDKAGARPGEIENHKKENRTIQSLLCASQVDEWPACSIHCDNFVMWKNNITETIREDLGSKWDYYKNKGEEFYGKPGGLNKNPLLIARALESAWKDNVKSNSLLKLVENIITFVKDKDMHMIDKSGTKQ